MCSLLVGNYVKNIVDACLLSTHVVIGKMYVYKKIYIF